MRTSAWFLLALLGACFSVAVAQNTGRIRGVVNDHDGHAVEGASVRCDRMDSRPSASALRIVETDKAGHFAFDNLGLESYKLFAIKESAGYPNTAFAFYSNNAFPTATLTAALPSVEVALKFGPPAGIVEGTVRDSISGRPVNPTILLRRASDFDNWISMSEPAEYRVLTPAATDTLIEVSARGYKTWYYGGPSDNLKRSPVSLRSLEHMKLDVALEPDGEAQSQVR